MSFPYEKQTRAPDAIEAAAGLCSWRPLPEASVSKTGLASMSCLNEAGVNAERPKLQIRGRVSVPSAGFQK